MITNIIICITVFVSIISMENHSLKNKLLFNPYMIHHRKEWYRFFTAAFIHADWMHLAFNMFSLYMFGAAVEREYAYLFEGKAVLFFILLYGLGILMSTFYSFEKHKNDIFYNALGASGAVSAVVFAYIILFPTQKLMFLFLPFPIPAYLFGVVFLGVEYYLGKRGNSNIGHDAHFWGAVHGVVFTIILKPTLIVSFIEQIKQ
jgi:membrane associated rhomboid family serine protease